MFTLQSNAHGAEPIALAATTEAAAITEAHEHIPKDPERWRRLTQNWVDWGWPGEPVIAAWNVTPDAGTHQMWVERT
ncbi:MAG TPA: hypothetical protein VF885_04865 [Arthrobacter sp.]